MSTNTPSSAAAKPKLKTSAMIASIAGEGQRTQAAPFGHALVELPDGITPRHHQFAHEAVGRAHAEALGHVRPATTMVEVSRLIEPWILVEIEATALIEG